MSLPNKPLNRLRGFITTTKSIPTPFECLIKRILFSRANEQIKSFGNYVQFSDMSETFLTFVDTLTFSIC